MLTLNLLCLLDCYTNNTGFNILKNIYTLSIHSFLLYRKTDFFSLCSFRYLFVLEDFSCHHLLWTNKCTSGPLVENAFHWVISFPSMTPTLSYILSLPVTLLHPSSGCHSSPDIFFVSSFLALQTCSRTWALIIFQFFLLIYTLLLQKNIPSKMLCKVANQAIQIYGGGKSSIFYNCIRCKLQVR